MPEADKKPMSAGQIWLMVGGTIIGLFLIGKCSAPADKVQPPFASASLENQIVEMTTTAPVEPLGIASVNRGVAHSKTVLLAEGLSGAMIYSQNCYDALTREFTWAKLDTCGAFDMVAARAASIGETEGLDTEVQYFEPESAAGRFLAAAGKAGEDGDAADKRLDGLQRKTARVPVPSRPNVSPQVEETVPTDEVDNVLGQEAAAGFGQQISMRRQTSALHAF